MGAELQQGEGRRAAHFFPECGVAVEMHVQGGELLCI